MDLAKSKFALWSRLPERPEQVPLRLDLLLGGVQSMLKKGVLPQGDTGGRHAPWRRLHRALDSCLL